MFSQSMPLIAERSHFVEPAQQLNLAERQMPMPGSQDGLQVRSTIRLIPSWETRGQDGNRRDGFQYLLACYIPLHGIVLVRIRSMGLEHDSIHAFTKMARRLALKHDHSFGATDRR